MATAQLPTLSQTGPPAPDSPTDDEKIYPADDKASVEIVERRTPSSLEENEKATVLDPTAGYDGFKQKTDPKEIKLVRKLDRYIVTSLWAMYWMNYLDRNAIALARLSSIESDLGMNDTQYQTAVSILFVGYVLCGIPSNMIINRVHVPYFLVGIMLTWAAISIGTGLVQNYASLIGASISSSHADARCREIFPRYRRGSLLCVQAVLLLLTSARPRRSLHPVDLLHSDGLRLSFNRV